MRGGIFAKRRVSRIFRQGHDRLIDDGCVMCQVQESVWDSSIFIALSVLVVSACYRNVAAGPRQTQYSVLYYPYYKCMKCIHRIEQLMGNNGKRGIDQQDQQIIPSKVEVFSSPLRFWSRAVSAVWILLTDSRYWSKLQARDYVGPTSGKHSRVSTDLANIRRFRTRNIQVTEHNTAQTADHIYLKS